MNRPADFTSDFQSLTGNPPFLWQRALFAELQQSRFPKICDIPTGLGKTATIAIWMLALAHRARIDGAKDFPRRLVYVVNRRTVVDQASREAEEMRSALTGKPELDDIKNALCSLAALKETEPLAISTLRGQFADNAEWRNDPARPAVIVGTVDMIGSRLLFSGYGCGFKSRPLHAGFLCQDALVIHDEAHLEPAFQQLLLAIQKEQERSHEFRPFHVMALTATARGSEESFRLTMQERNPDCVPDAGPALEEVWKRTRSKKGIEIYPVAEEKKIADRVSELALQHQDSGEAVLVFLQKLENVQKVKDKLPDGAVQVLTGTLRGLERDELAKSDPIFARFLPSKNRKVIPTEGTVYLVCTSAGEVGVDISADHLICDLMPFDSMAQRFGRVNRFGLGDAKIDVVYAPFGKLEDAADKADLAETIEAATTVASEAADEIGDSEEKSETSKTKLSAFDNARQRTLVLLQKLPQREDQRFDASPKALSELSCEERQAAFTPPPVVLPATDILFDVWALTSIRQPLPGRPPVADWLHGVSEWQPPETRVAWREEVQILTASLRNVYGPQDLLEDYPLKPHELLRDSSERVFKHLKKLADKHGDTSVWLLAGDNSVEVQTLNELTAGDKSRLSGRTVLLPPKIGGLRNGMLDGAANVSEKLRYDVADQWLDENGLARRCRVWDDDPHPKTMRPVRTIDIQSLNEGESDGDERTGRRIWRWYVRHRSADDEGSRHANKSQDLQAHLESAEGFAKALEKRLCVPEEESAAITFAVRWHDRGKHRDIWQRSIGNTDYPVQILAKSGGKQRSVLLSHYRHEFGSLREVFHDGEFAGFAPDVQDLALHLIAAHHGRARPHFIEDESFDPDCCEAEAAVIAREVPRRFARLQRKYGRWGLAYLESLVRAADILASQQSEPTEATESVVSTESEAKP